MVMMEPDHYFAERSVEKSRNINIIGSMESKDGSLASHLVSSLKGCMTRKQHLDHDMDGTYRVWSAESLQSHDRREAIKARQV